MDIGNIMLCRRFPRFSIRIIKKTFPLNGTLVGAEVGTFKGENAENIINVLKPRKLYLIDPYESYNEYQESYLINIRKLAERRLERFKDKVEMVWIKKPSEIGLKEIPKELDFIYIDGNHTYPFVKKDLELAWIKIKKGGILCGHDFGVPGVAKAVIEFSEKNKLSLDMYNVNLRDGDWYFIKK